MKQALDEAMKRRKMHGLDVTIVLGPHGDSGAVEPQPMKGMSDQKMEYKDNDAVEDSDDGKEENESLGLAPEGSKEHEKSELAHEEKENELLGKMEKLQAHRTQEAEEDVEHADNASKDHEEMEAAMMGNLDDSEKRRILEAEHLSLRDAMIKRILERKHKA